MTDVEVEKWVRDTETQNLKDRINYLETQMNASQFYINRQKDEITLLVKLNTEFHQATSDLIKDVRDAYTKIATLESEFDAARDDAKRYLHALYRARRQIERLLTQRENTRDKTEQFMADVVWALTRDEKEGPAEASPMGVQPPEEKQPPGNTGA